MAKLEFLTGKRRYLVAGIVAATFAAGAAVLAGGSSAQAFACYRGNPGPQSCPFVKVETQGPSRTYHYDVTGKIVSPSGQILQQWSERDPEYTLWHWRYYGDDSTISMTITPGDGTVGGGPKTFEFPAAQTHCYIVNLGGVFPTTGCNDNEDPPR